MKNKQKTKGERIYVVVSILLIFSIAGMVYNGSTPEQKTCSQTELEENLRNAVYNYLSYDEDFAGTNITLDKIKSLLNLYLANTNKTSFECGDEKNVIENIKAMALQHIPQCSDGTYFGKCSETKPMYCYAGNLVPRCRLCECPTGQWCDEPYVYTEKSNLGQWGKCYPLTCSIDTNCGTASYVGNYYCQNGDVYKNYTSYTCLSPGKSNSTCTSETTAKLIDDCGTGKRCTEGQNSCQIVEIEKQSGSLNPKEEGFNTHYFCNNTDVFYINISDWSGCQNPKIYWAYIKRASEPTLIENVSIINVGGCATGQNDWTICETSCEGKGKVVGNVSYEISYECSCLDGTPYGQCSSMKPKYCDKRNLVDNCQVCGCSTGYGCQKEGICKPVCSDGTPYDTCSITKPKYCDNGTHTLTDNCQLCGCDTAYGCQKDSTCQLVCSDRTLYGKCSTTKPKYCNNGILVDNCQACGCESWQTCQQNGVCTTLRCLDGTEFRQCSTTKPKYCDNGILVDKCKVCGCENVNDICARVNVSKSMQEPLSTGDEPCIVPSGTLFDDGDTALDGRQPSNGNSLTSYGWDSGSAIYSDSNPRSGTLGFSFGQGSTVSQIIFDTPVNGGDISAWMYDDMTMDASKQKYIAVAGENGYMALVGYFGSPDSYAIRYLLYGGSGLQLYSHCCCGKRSLGWHNLQIKADGEIYVDGGRVTDRPYITGPIKRIELHAKNVGEEGAFMDDFSFTYF